MTPETSAAVDCLSSALIGFHWETHPADTDELQRAAAFFRRAPPQVMYTASSLYQVPYTGLPEVAFLGRSNVGKSTLLNALLGTKVCRTSSKPGKTRALHAYAVGDSSGTIGSNGDGRKLAKTAPTKTTAPTAPTPPPSPPRSQLTVLDMPGYGHGSRAEWGRTVATYLARRRELRRAFVLVDALHGIKERDALMLEELRAAGVAHQVVLSKVDRVVLPQHATGRNVQRTTWERKLEHLATLVAAVRKVAQPEGKDARGRGQPALGEILCVSADMGRYSHLSDEAGGTMGVNALRWSVLAATGLTGFGGGRKPRVGDEDSPILIDESR